MSTSKIRSKIQSKIQNKPNMLKFDQARKQKARGGHFFPLLCLSLTALALRLVPLTFSHLPYNIDGFPLVKISDDITGTGEWNINRYDEGNHLLKYNNKMPGLSILLSMFNLVSSYSPPGSAQLFIPFLSIASVLMLYFIAWKMSRSRLVAYLAGFFVCSSGFYIYLTTAVMKQTLGFALIPTIYYLQHSIYQRMEGYNGSPPFSSTLKKRALCALLLLLLPFIHHLTTLIVFTTISLFFIIHFFRDLFDKNLRFRTVFLDFAFGPMLFLFAYLYYSKINMEHFTTVSNVNDAVLFLSVLFVYVLLCLYLCFRVPASAQGRWSYIFNWRIITPIIGFSIILMNHYIKIFPATINTSTLFLKFIFPYLVLVCVAFVGFNIISGSDSEFRYLITSIFAGTLTVVSFALIRGSDFFSFDLSFRGYGFIEVPLALCTGIGVAYLSVLFSSSKVLRKILSPSRATAIFTVSFIILAAGTIPLAYNGMELYGVQDITYDDEFAPMRWVSLHTGTTIGTDQRYSDILGPYLGMETDRTVPWDIRDGKTPGAHVILAEESWTTKGAQMFPFERAKISESNFNRTLNSNNLVYTLSSDDTIYVIVKV